MFDKNKLEAEALKTFLKLYFGGENVSFQKPSEEGMPDGYVPEKQLLIEVKELHDRNQINQFAKWSTVIGKLQKAVNKVLKNKPINGAYLIDTPEDVSSPTETEKFDMGATEVVEAVCNGESKVDVFGQAFKITKISNEGNHITFGNIGKGGSFNAADTIYENLNQKILKANQQLEKFSKLNKVKKRILLISNQYNLLTWDWDLFKGMGYLYNELRESKSIDEIWFLYPKASDEDKIKLIYKKSLFDKYETEKIGSLTLQDSELYANWFSVLVERDSTNEKRLINSLKAILGDKEPYKVFPTPDTRIEMVRFGNHLIEKENYSDALWLVNKFINDPSPCDPPAEGREGYEYHRTIKDAVKPETHAIVTVKGHLAWTVQLLANKKETIEQAYTLTKNELLRTKNLYVLFQWLIPLIEISSKRFWLKEVNKELYWDFRELCFQILNKYSTYPDISKELVHLFYYLRELDSKEAMVVIDKLISAEDIEAIILYYALFRKNNFTDKKYLEEFGAYEDEPVRNFLSNLIENTSPEYDIVRSGIAWNFWKILSEDKKNLEMFLPYINKFFMSLSYKRHISDNLERIVEDIFDYNSDQALVWLKQILESTTTYLAKRPDVGRDVWLTCDTEELTSKIANKYPEQLEGIINLLFEIWKYGAYVGTPSKILESYKFISDENLRNTLKRSFQKIYLQMKEMNPKLQEVTFE